MGKWLAIALPASMLAGCLDAPARGEDPVGPAPGGGEGSADPDGGGDGPLQACGLSVTYASVLQVGGPDRAFAVGGFGVIGNLGDAPVKLTDLEVVGITPPEDGALSVDIRASVDLLPPGEAHGELDDDVVESVTEQVLEPWTDTSVPTLFLQFQGHDGFHDTEAVVALALGDMIFPLSFRFIDGDGFNDEALASSRVVAACP